MDTRGTRKNLQFFDSDGTSVHKIYQTDNGDSDAWDHLVDEFKTKDQTPGITVSEPGQAYVPQAADVTGALP